MVLGEDGSGLTRERCRLHKVSRVHKTRNFRHRGSSTHRSREERCHNQPTATPAPTTAAATAIQAFRAR